MGRTVVISNVIKRQRSAVPVLYYHLSLNDEGQVTFVAPVIADVRRTIFHHAKLYLSELA